MTKKYVYFADFFLTKIGLYHIIELRKEVEVENENYSSGKPSRRWQSGSRAAQRKAGSGGKNFRLSYRQQP